MSRVGRWQIVNIWRAVDKNRLRRACRELIQTAAQIKMREWLRETAKRKTLYTHFTVRLRPVSAYNTLQKYYLNSQKIKKKCILVIFIRNNKQKHQHCLLLLWILVRVKKPARSYCHMVIPEYILTPSSFCQPLERLPWRQGGKGWVSWHWAEFGNLQIIRRWRIL